MIASTLLYFFVSFEKYTRYNGLSKVACTVFGTVSKYTKSKQIQQTYRVGVSSADQVDQGLAYTDHTLDDANSEIILDFLTTRCDFVTNLVVRSLKLQKKITAYVIR